MSTLNSKGFGREDFLKPDFFFSGWLEEASPGAWKFFREAYKSAFFYCQFQFLVINTGFYKSESVNWTMT
jgi:hypothetical protein